MELGRISLSEIKQSEKLKQMENGTPSVAMAVMPCVEAVVLKPLDSPIEVVDGSKPANTISPPQTLGDLNLILRAESSSSDSSDSDDDDDDDEAPPTQSSTNPVPNSKNSKVLPEKRRRSQPVKFEPSPIGSRKHITKPHTPKSVPSKVFSAGKLRGTRCGRCPGCLKEDCGKCAFCKDKPKFGGPGKKKQRCKQRICNNFQHRTGSDKSGPTRPYPSINGDSSFDEPSTSAPAARKLATEKPLTAGQITYNKLAKQMASTKSTQGARIELEKEPVATVSPVSGPTHQTIPAEATPTTGTAAEVHSPPMVPSTKLVTVDITPSTSNGVSTVEKKNTTSVLAPNKAVPKSALVSTPKVDIKKPSDRMTCIQCGRERALSMARTDQFCTQRCITNWEESNSSKQPPVVREVKKTVVVDIPSKTESPPRSLPRALKNLQIDMAKPGTKLTSSESESGDAKTTASSVATRSSLINSLASMISQSQKQMDSPKAGAGSETPSLLSASAATVKTPDTAKSTTQPAKVAAKRSTNVQLVSSAKRAKLSTKTTPQSASKSVSFNLKADENGNGKASSPSPSNVIPLIASMLQPKKSHDPPKIKIPSGLPSDIRQWTVGHVIHYFKSTADCQDYIDLFEAQEVDGIALLLLTHETLVKCLGIKLGRALKIMNRVQELKRYHDHKSSK